MSVVRVCAITSDCYPADPLVRRTAEAAASGGYEYHVICSMEDGQPKEEIYNGVHVHRVYIEGGKKKPLGRITAMPFSRTVFLWLLFALLSFLKVARLHVSRKFDVVHVHNLPDFLVFAALIPKCLGSKVILHVQDVAPELMAVKAEGLWRAIAVCLAGWQERMSTAFADHVITVGWPFEQILVKRGLSREKLTVILNSADPTIFRAEKRTPPFLGKPTAERPLILMYHGTCAERCSLDTAVRALAEAKTAAPHLRLHFMGGGESVPHLKELAQRLDVADHVVFFPSSPLEKVAEFLVNGDIGLIPYRSDGFMNLLLPTKAYEFAWMRRPIIASDLLGIRSMFRPVSIRLCESSNIEMFAEAIIDLYYHPQKRAELVANAEQDYLQYRWEISAERYRQVLASLIQHKVNRQARWKNLLRANR
jgi:glycosyltransferase involved in cell wall biosynthesis